MSRLQERFKSHRSVISNADLAEFLFIMYEDIMQSIAALQQAVAAEDTVIGSAVTLIQGIAAQVSAAGVDPVALQAVVDDINTQAQNLAAAIQANTTPVTGS